MGEYAADILGRTKPHLDENQMSTVDELLEVMEGKSPGDDVRLSVSAVRDALDLIADLAPYQP